MVGVKHRFYIDLDDIEGVAISGEDASFALKDLDSISPSGTRGEQDFVEGVTVLPTPIERDSNSLGLVSWTVFRTSDYHSRTPYVLTLKGLPRIDVEMPDHDLSLSEWLATRPASIPSPPARVSVAQLPVAGPNKYLRTDGNDDWYIAPVPSGVPGSGATETLAPVSGRGTATDPVTIPDGALGGPKLAANSVSRDKIASAAVDTDELANGAVTTAKVADGAVTASKLAAGVLPSVPARAGAFTAADEAKLDGIESGAEVNPRNTFACSVIDTDTLTGVDDAAMGLILADNTIWSSGSIRESVVIELPSSAALPSADPLNPDADLAAYTAHRSLFDDLADNGGGVLLSLQVRGTSTVAIVQADTVARVADAGDANGFHYALSNLTWVGDDYSGTAGVGWQLSGGRTYGVILNGDTQGTLPVAHGGTGQSAWAKVLEAIVAGFETLTGSWLRRLRTLVQGNNEAVTLTVTRVAGTPTQAGEIGLDNLANGTGQVLLWPPATTKDDTPITLAELREYRSGDFADLGSLEWVLGATPWTTFEGDVLQAAVLLAPDYAYAPAHLPAVNASVDLVLEGRDIHVGNVVRAILKRATTNIGGKGGTQGQVWTRGSSDDNAGWGDLPDKPNAEDVVPFAAAFRSKVDREFKQNNLSAVDGEAFVSEGNNVPAGAPSGTTDFVVVDVDDSSGTSERAVLEAVSVGDWLRAESGGKYIIAQILHINEDALNDAYEYWFNPSTEIAETLQYDALPTGAGNVRFYTRPDVVTLPTSTDTDTDVTEADTNLVTGASDGDLYAITFLGAWSSETDNPVIRTVIIEFQHLPTSYHWISIRGGTGGARFMLRRSGSNIQWRRAGAVGTSSTAYAYKLN